MPKKLISPKDPKAAASGAPHGAEAPARHARMLACCWFLIKKGDGDGAELLSRALGAGWPADGSGAKAKVRGAIWAATMGGPRSLELLIAAGAWIGGDSPWMTPMMTAAQSGQAECLRVLISAGADLEERDGAGRTAAVYAAFGEKAECLRLLIQAGCDIDSRAANGASVDDCAKGGCVEVLRDERVRRAAVSEAELMARELPGAEPRPRRSGPSL